MNYCVGLFPIKVDNCNKFYETDFLIKAKVSFDCFCKIGIKNFIILY